MLSIFLSLPNYCNRYFLFQQFLPARKVKEKASKLRNTLPTDMLSGKISKNILAMTFRQVILQHIWSFELVSFGPGAERNMEDLENSREVTFLPLFLYCFFDSALHGVMLPCWPSHLLTVFYFY